MVQVVMGGVEDFNHLIFQNKNPNTLHWLKNQFNNFSTTLTEAGRSFMQGSQELFNQFNGAAAINAAKAAMQRAGSLFQRDEIRPIWTIEEMQTAMPVMQRWIMANPTVRESYHNQQCDGYSESYIDVEPDQIGRNHYDYQQVMNGVLVDDGEGGWTATNYLHDLRGEDTLLSLSDKIDILTTWDMVSAMMDAKHRDPTSIFNGSL